MLYTIVNTQIKRLEIEIPDLRYINYFLRLKCCVDLIKLEIYPNAKEITEAVAIRKAIAKAEILMETETHFVIVGDGKTPRVGALLCFTTPCNLTSIDPDFKIVDYPIKRLTCIKQQAEIIDYSFLNTAKTVVFIFPHSHAPMPKVLKQFFNTSNHNQITLIDMPCCYNFDIGKPDIEYKDFGVWSEKRKIKIYRNFTKNSL